MAVQYQNNQLYDVFSNKLGQRPTGFSHAQLMNPQQYNPYNFVQGLGNALPIGAPTGQAQQQPNTGMYGDPFGTAMSGNKSGTLQPYVNRMTQNASNALYGGLLNYQPQSMVAGDAGGTPQNSSVPQGFNIQSALKQAMGGQGLNFGNRSWMQGASNG